MCIKLVEGITLNMLGYRFGKYHPRTNAYNSSTACLTLVSLPESSETPRTVSLCAEMRDDRNARRDLYVLSMGRSSEGVMFERPVLC